MENQKKQKIGVIVQARMGSTRLPGKVLMDLDENEKVLDVLIKRLKLSKSIDEIIIATTPDRSNSLIIDLAKSNNIPFFVGSEENVLERHYKTAKKFNIDLIVRVTSDCPFVDPRILDDMVIFYENNNYDFLMNVDGITSYPIGFDIQIFSFQILEKLYNFDTTKEEKEYIPRFILKHPESFSTISYNDKNLKFYEDLRLTIDYKEDLTLLREVYKRLKNKGKSIDFTLEDVLEIVEENPEIMNINKHHRWR